VNPKTYQELVRDQVFRKELNDLYKANPALVIAIESVRTEADSDENLAGLSSESIAQRAQFDRGAKYALRRLVRLMSVDPETKDKSHQEPISWGALLPISNQ
jgi:hypothetical protein